MVDDNILDPPLLETSREHADDTALLDYCPICYDNVIVDGEEAELLMNGTFKFSCSHRFCIDCAVYSVKHHILDNELNRLLCPDASCKKQISDDDINRLFVDEPDVTEKLEKWRGIKVDTANPLFRYCVKPNCPGNMIAKNAKVKFVQCTICDTKVCFPCKDRHHPGISCDENMERTYQMSFGSKKNVSRCPMCRTPIQRTAGCNHMTCAFCFYEFCWICDRGATADSGHWNEYALNGCGAGQLDPLTKRDLSRLRQK